MLAINVYICDIFIRDTQVFYFAFVCLGQSTLFGLHVEANVISLSCLLRSSVHYGGLLLLLLLVLMYLSFIISENLSAGAGQSLRRDLQNDL